MYLYLHQFSQFVFFFKPDIFILLQLQFLVKPSTHSYPSAPHITTLPHRTDLPCLLQGVLLPYRNGIRYLEAGFALRCFQRLSLPDLATQLCSWQNNWNTSGQFIPVLSY